MGEVTGFPTWFYSQNVRERFPHAAYKADVFFLTILRGSLKAIEKLREQGRGEKRKTLLLPPPSTTSFLTGRPLPLINS